MSPTLLYDMTLTRLPGPRLSQETTWAGGGKRPTEHFNENKLSLDKDLGRRQGEGNYWLEPFRICC